MRDPVDVAAEAIRRHSNGSAHSSAAVAIAALRASGWQIEYRPKLGSRVDEILSPAELAELVAACSSPPRRGSIRSFGDG